MFDQLVLEQSWLLLFPLLHGPDIHCTMYMQSKRLFCIVFDVPLNTVAFARWSANMTSRSAIKLIKPLKIQGFHYFLIHHAPMAVVAFEGMAVSTCSFLHWHAEMLGVPWPRCLMNFHLPSLVGLIFTKLALSSHSLTLILAFCLSLTITSPHCQLLLLSMSRKL